jgi:hypothetical protein
MENVAVILLVSDDRRAWWGYTAAADCESRPQR